MQIHFTRTPHFPENLNNYAPWVATYGLLVPYRCCQCGCGEKTAVMKTNDANRNEIAGHSRRFRRGHHKRLRSLEERFWSKVDKRGLDECWEWTAGKINGYGQISLKKQHILAHRLSYKLHYGSIPNELDVLHKCDNPGCVNPNHLFAGTHTDNMQDKARKGRAWTGDKKGEHGPSHKLTETAVLDIRQRASRGESRHVLARDFDVSYVTIGEIIRRVTWTHV